MIYDSLWAIGYSVLKLIGLKYSVYLPRYLCYSRYPIFLDSLVSCCIQWYVKMIFYGYHNASENLFRNLLFIVSVFNSSRCNSWWYNKLTSFEAGTVQRALFFLLAIIDFSIMCVYFCFDVGQAFCETARRIYQYLFWFTYYKVGLGWTIKIFFEVFFFFVIKLWGVGSQ